MFAYLITNLFEGRVVGTNDSGKAHDASYAEEFFVVDTALQTQIVDGVHEAIPEVD